MEIWMFFLLFTYTYANANPAAVYDKPEINAPMKSPSINSVVK